MFFRGEHFRFRVGKDCFVSRGEYPFAVDTTAGVDGAFRIPKIDGIERLEAVHPEGWATVPLDPNSTASIQLQPWGRINGVVQSSQGVVPGAEVEIRAPQTGFGTNSLAQDIEVKPGQATNLTFSAQAQ